MLHSLATDYAVPYEALMEKAGYLLPSGNGGGQCTRLAALAFDGRPLVEEEELLESLACLCVRAPS